MSFIDRWLGREPQPRTREAPDDAALARYRYLLRTAPPEALEQVHAEAFARLTVEQRARVLAEIASAAPAEERAAAASVAGDPGALARFATRAELRRPGLLERVLGGAPALGPSLAGSFLAGALGSVVAQRLFHGGDAFEGAGFGDEGEDDRSGGLDAPEETDFDPGVDTDFGAFDV